MIRLTVLLPLAALVALLAASPGAQPGQDPPRRVTAAGTHRSPEVARRLTLEWHDAIVPAGEPRPPTPGSDAPPPPRDRLPLDRFRAQVRRQRLGPRPAVIHVFDPSFKMGELLQLEQSVFGTESLLIACTFLDNFRVKSGPDLPAGFWTADAAGKVIARLPLNPTRREVETAVGAAFGSHYDGELAPAVAAYAAWLERLESAEDAVARERSPAAAVALVRVRREETEARPAMRKKPERRPKPPGKAPER